jgi:hypothetical protein
MVASYLLEPGRREHGLDSLALQHLDHRTTTYEEVAGKGKAQVPFAEVELEDACDYACEDADIALRLAERFAPELERLHLDGLFRDVEMPLVRGARGDGVERHPHRRAVLRATRDGGGFRKRAARLEGEIYAGGGDRVQHRLQPAAPGDPLRAAGLPVVKRPRRAPPPTWTCSSSSPPGPPPADAADGVPAAGEAAQHLRGGAAADGEPGDGAHPHLVQPDGGGDGAALLQRPQPAEHPHPHGAGRGDPPRLHPRGGERLRLGRLLADRAAHPRALLGGRGVRGGVPRRDRHPPRDGGTHLRRGGGRR